MKRSLCLAVGLAVGVSLAPAASADPPAGGIDPKPSVKAFQPARYDIQGLTVPAGYDGAVAAGIDSEGWVFGYAFKGNAGNYFDQTRRAVRWSKTGAVQLLGPATAIDGASAGVLGGKPVYWTMTKVGADERIDGFVNDQAIPGFVPKGVVGGRVHGWLYFSAVNPNHGAGYIYPTGEKLTANAVDVFAMNASGVIAGTGLVPSHDTTYRLAYGTAAQANLLPGYGYFAAIDAQGVAVGARSTVPSDPHAPYRVYRYKPGSVDEELGTLGGTVSRAYAVTSDGKKIVGYSTDAAELRRAFIYQNGKMYALDTLVDYPPPPPAPAPPPAQSDPRATPTTPLRTKPIPTPQEPPKWLSVANGINDKGEICGTGYTWGKAIPFVLRPKSTVGIAAINVEALKKTHLVGPLPALEPSRVLTTTPKPR